MLDELLVNIPINLDEVNETDEEFFIVHFRLDKNGTINEDLVQIDQEFSKGVIIDNQQRGISD